MTPLYDDPDLSLPPFAIEAPAHKDPSVLARSPGNSRGPCRDHDHDTAILAAVKREGSFRMVANEFEISVETIRRIVTRYEAATGEYLPRWQRNYTKHPLAARVHNGSIAEAASPDLTVNELAEKLGIGAQRIRGYLNYHELPYRKVGEATRARVLAAYEPTLTRSEIAAKSGVPHHSVNKYLKGLPTRRSNMPLHSRRDVQRHEAIIASVRQTRSFAITGQEFGISRERVRQIALGHEHATGEWLSRYARTKPPVRIDQACSGGCGVSRATTPFRIGYQPNWHCRDCQPGSKFPHISDIIAVVQARVAGTTWSVLGRERGFAANAVCSGFQLAVYRRLRRSGRLDLIEQVWPTGIPRWLLLRYGPFAKSLLTEARGQQHEGATRKGGQS